jgi:hypothetical protein
MTTWDVHRRCGRTRNGRSGDRGWQHTEMMAIDQTVELWTHKYPERDISDIGRTTIDNTSYAASA